MQALLKYRSQGQQVVQVVHLHIEKYWAGASEHVVLKIETAKLSGNLVLEANPGGTNKYYHLYKGSIPLNAIVESKVHKK